MLKKKKKKALAVYFFYVELHRKGVALTTICFSAMPGNNLAIYLVTINQDVCIELGNV